MIHIHDHQQVVQLVRPQVVGLPFSADGISAALKIVSALIDQGRIGIGHVAGCPVCEHPMGHGHDHGFVFQGHGQVA